MLLFIHGCENLPPHQDYIAQILTHKVKVMTNGVSISPWSKKNEISPFGDLLSLPVQVNATATSLSEYANTSKVRVIKPY